MAAAVMQVDCSIPLVHLMHDAPACRPDLAAYLVPACCRSLPAGSVLVAVVDPGVGGPRDAIVVETRRFTAVGPDNGLLSRLQAISRVSRITWQPAQLSNSFHGRDLFAPVAAMLAIGRGPAMEEIAPDSIVGSHWDDALMQVVYIDGFGNAMTGLQGVNLIENNKILLSGRRIAHAPTFSAVGEGELFWFVNSQGLVEIAGNRVSAAAVLSLALGDRFLID
jgi:S-adenosylmethionine hydrolase